MAKVFLGIGSNIDREKNISLALKALAEILVDMDVSPIYESEAVGFEGDNFFNLVVSGETHFSLDVLVAAIKELEMEHGKPESAPKYSPRTLDIDVLTFDQLVGEFNGVELPRTDVVELAYVLKPLSDLAPDEVHPVQQKSYKSLWLEFDCAEQKIWMVEHELHN